MQPQANHHHPLPQAHAIKVLSIDELMQATLRLSDLLQEESQLIQEMRFKDLPKLQEEKIKLTALLEMYQQRLATDASFVRSADEKVREELLLLTDDLAYTVEENFRQVSTARAVNSRIMQAMMDVMNDQHRPGTYGRTGAATGTGDMALSMNLNQKA